MRGCKPGESTATTRLGLARHRFASPILASILGCSVGLYMLTVSGVDPWLWWSDYLDRTRPPAVTPVRKPPATSVVQPNPIGTDSSLSPAPRRLLLQSTRRGRNARDGTAAIGVHAGSPQIYRAGALLANGARLTEVHEDWIVLERDGQTARLYVDGNEPADYVDEDSALFEVGGNVRAAAALPDSADALTDVMRVTPVFEGDAVRALEIHANERSDVFNRLGLQPGDRITSVNGVQVTDTASSIAALRRLTLGEALQVTVSRQDNLETLSLDGSIVTPARSARQE